MRFSKRNVTLHIDDLHSYMELAWRTCWDTVEKRKAEGDKWFSDYVTASDIEACVRWLIDRDQDQLGSDSWWGYQGCCRIRVVGGHRGDMLGRCRKFMAGLLARGVVEAHNFGRGHCSGVRFRPKGTGLNEKEKRTIENKTKEKPVHYRREGGKPLCTANRKPTARSYRHRNVFNPKIRVTNEAEKVTCPRCKNLMEKANE